MVLAMHNVRTGLVAALDEAPGVEPALRGAAARAISRLCDAELAIMIETFEVEFSGILARRERLAAIGQLGAIDLARGEEPLERDRRLDLCPARAPPREHGRGRGAALRPDPEERWTRRTGS